MCYLYISLKMILYIVQQVLIFQFALDLNINYNEPSPARRGGEQTLLMINISTNCLRKQSVITFNH